MEWAVCKTTSCTDPQEYTDASIVEILDGATVNNTHLIYTFLCKGCMVRAPVREGFQDVCLRSGSVQVESDQAGFIGGCAAIPCGKVRHVRDVVGPGSAKYNNWVAKAKAKATGANASASASASVPVSASSTPLSRVCPKVSNVTYDYIVAAAVQRVSSQRSVSPKPSRKSSCLSVAVHQLPRWARITHFRGITV